MWEKAYKNLDIVLDDFDFKKVKKAMKALDWTWFPNNRTPKVSEMKQTCRGLLKTAIGLYKNNPEVPYETACTGGFELFLDKETQDIEVKFVVTEIDTSWYKKD